MNIAIRIGATAYWLAVIAAVLFVLPAQIDGLLVYSGILILGFHVLEVLAVFTLWKERLKPTPKDVLPILMFGAFYLRPKLDATR